MVSRGDFECLKMLLQLQEKAMAIFLLRASGAPLLFAHVEGDRFAAIVSELAADDLGRQNRAVLSPESP